MTNPKIKNRVFILLLFGMAIIPFLLAWMMNGNAPFYVRQNQ